MWITVPLFIAGFFLSFKEFSTWWPFHLLFLHRVAVTAAFFGYARGLAAIYFVVTLFMIYPFLKIRGMNWLNQLKLETLMIIMVLFFTLFALIPVIRPVRFEASGSSESRTGYLIQDAEMKIWPKNE